VSEAPQPRRLPYGSWPSPLRAETIVERAAALGDLHVGPEDLWWSESRPDEGGRVAIVRHRPGGEAHDVLPPECSARTSVHEYGGGAWWLHEDVLFFVNWDDQRLYRVDPGSSPRPLTPASGTPAAARYADGSLTPDGRWVIGVRELHGSEGEAEPRNEIVAIDADAGGEPVVLVRGPDFVSFPRVSPDGRSLCWTQWNHPDLPWDRTELWMGRLVERNGTVELADARLLAGGEEAAIFQPSWTPAGDLLFVSDRDEWWNLQRFDAHTLDSDDRPHPRPLTEVDGEIGVPQWVFGQSRYAVLDDGRVLCAVARRGLDHLAVVEGGGPDATLRFLATPFTTLGSVRAFGAGAALIGGSPTSEPVVAVLDVPDQGDPQIAVARPARDLGMGEAWIATPEPISFPTTGGATAHALFYRPTNPDVDGRSGEAPPLVVLSHGGPTSAARPQLNLTIQYWTTRGLAVVDVNYRGSTGFGRSYRHALDGEWGVVDVDDCIAAARHLVASGEADGDRLAIRGSSAGGYTTLCAIAFHDVFRAAASLYGVADLEALARDTHKFESRSLDRLIGPYPELRERYRRRSPVHHAEQISCPLIVFQGLDDRIVPPAQSRTLVDALRAKHLPLAYLTFEGEQHGFRQTANIRRVLEAELYFYSRVLGFGLAGEVEPVPIENL
jgi:dipeptidyl aminopeptidase/acylaminoacyl peptidase